MAFYSLSRVYVVEVFYLCNVYNYKICYKTFRFRHIYIYIYARCSDNWKDYKKGKRGGESAPNSQKEEMVLVTLKMQ